MSIKDEAAARAYVAGVCDDVAMNRLDRFVSMLADENQQQNLVSRPSMEVVWQRHIADSAQLLEHVPRETGLWIDLGSGAGLPGLVVAIMRPEWHIMLIESRKRRIEWLAQVKEDLSLDQCEIVGRRLELVETVPASVISARAFAPLAKTISLSKRFSTSETQWLLPKGRSAAQELGELPVKDRKLFHVEQSCTDDEAGIIVGRLANR